MLRLASLQSWHSLSNGRFQMELCLNQKLIKKWKRMIKREAKEVTKQGELFDPSTKPEVKFLRNLIEEFLEVLDSTVFSQEQHVNEDNKIIDACGLKQVDDACVLYYESYLRPLVADVAVVAKCHLSALYKHEKGKLFAQLVELLQFYEKFEINDHVGTQLTDDEVLQSHYDRFQSFQLLAFKKIPRSVSQQAFINLRELALANIGAINKRADLSKKLSELSPIDLRDLVCHKEAVPHLLAYINNEGETAFRGWSRMAVPIKEFKITEVKQPNIGEVKPSSVTVDVTFIISSYKAQIRSEWNALKEHDVLFLLSIRPSFEPLSAEEAAKASVPQRLGLQYVRGCEIIEIRDEEGTVMNDFTGRIKRDEEKPPKGELRTITVALDTTQYHMDVSNITEKGVDDVYGTFNVLMKRKPKENNFKAILESIRDLMNEYCIVPDWLHNVFLGYGNPSAAQWTNMPDLLEMVDFKIGAIISGIQPGLTMVVGPPGTGKTDTAVQILNVLYHNCPSQRTLIITHSNQALNDLFEKIMQRDVPARYLLLLGQGEQELATDHDFSRQGRVNAMLVRQLELLGEVERLARSLQLPEDVGYTYEIAGYFWLLHAMPVAMTCTHAALKRKDFLQLGFKYDNLLMEESAQILEIETFIPMLLQRQEDGYARLKRCILIGDHH
ncbi:hypothetical protein CMV_012634 [Castanea mollissima]|uniref:Intron-binding protein aquarius n=1 Tax=Castanea mollissima TaxID=60419 RepID=A0A8J4QZL2_9ROSI|nr:hypothetical protein CMV_012634 [Castanea mollissima]